MLEKDAIWKYALNIVSRREYSSDIVRQKLNNRYGDDGDNIELVIERLIELGFIDDERYSLIFFRVQIDKLRGPIRILNEARKKGVYEKVSVLVRHEEVDWVNLAASAMKKKFGEGPDLKQKDKAKIYRYLSYQGFESEHILSVVG